MSAGASVQLWDDRLNDHNHWRLHPCWVGNCFTIQSVASSLFLCVPEGNQELGTRPILRTLPSDVDMSFGWEVQQHDGRDTYAIMNLASQTFLNVAGGRMEYGNKVHMWDNPGYDDSQWRFEAPMAIPTGDLLEF